MYFRRVKAFRGAVGAPPKSGLWLGPARVIMTEPVQQWSSWAHNTTGQVGVVWLSRGDKLTRSHPTQLRHWSERKAAIAPSRSLIPVSLSTSDLTSALAPGQYEDMSSNLPSRDELHQGSVDLEPSVNPLAPSWVGFTFRCVLRDQPFRCPGSLLWFSFFATVDELPVRAGNGAIKDIRKTRAGCGIACFSRGRHRRE